MSIGQAGLSELSSICLPRLGKILGSLFATLSPKDVPQHSCSKEEALGFPVG